MVYIKQNESNTSNCATKYRKKILEHGIKNIKLRKMEKDTGRKYTQQMKKANIRNKSIHICIVMHCNTTERFL